jgi:hypothetical protein
VAYSRVFLQLRSWRYQKRRALREEERQKASDVCQRISSLVDKRLYRLQRLLWAIVGCANGRMTAEAIDDRLHEYDEVLYEWNDELNARLAVVGAYSARTFGVSSTESYTRRSRRQANASRTSIVRSPR